MNFQIAEFGLLDEHKIVKELYLYYSLTLFQLGKLDEAQEFVKKVKPGLNIKNLSSITIPQSIKIPVKAMLTALSLPRRTGEADYRRKVFSFELLFLNTIEQFAANKIDAVQNNIKKLEQLDKDMQEQFKSISGVKVSN